VEPIVRGLRLNGMMRASVVAVAVVAVLGGCGGSSVTYRSPEQMVDRLNQAGIRCDPIEHQPFRDEYGALTLQCTYGPNLGARTDYLYLYTYPTHAAEADARSHAGAGGPMYWGHGYAFGDDCCQGEVTLTPNAKAIPAGDSLGTLFDRMKSALT
jgi:hypothetical protein